MKMTIFHHVSDQKRFCSYWSRVARCNLTCMCQDAMAPKAGSWRKLLGAAARAVTMTPDTWMRTILLMAPWLKGQWMA